MKIAVLIDTWFPFVGGGQINAWEISKRLAQKGTDVEIITRNCGLYSHKAQKNLKITKLGPISKTTDEIARLKYLVQALLYVFNKDIDLLVAHAFLPGLVARIFMLLRRKPAVLIVHGSSIKSGLNKGFKLWLEKFILTQIKYSAEITVSRDFFKLKNVNKNIIYIPNGVEVKPFDRIKVNKFKEKTILFVGRLHPQKNLHRLFRSIDELNKRFSNFRLLIVGDGSESMKLKELIKSLKLENRIIMMGELRGNNLIKVYKSSHIFILPSIYEGFPLTLLEAWAARLPVVVSKTGDCQYLIKNGVNGHLIKGQSTQDISNAITESLINKNLRVLGENGYNFAKHKYSWEKSEALTYTVFKKIIKAS